MKTTIRLALLAMYNDDGSPVIQAVNKGKEYEYERSARFVKWMTEPVEVEYNPNELKAVMDKNRRIR
jgi:hypothetical protein